MKQLKHTGVLIPPKPVWKKLHVTVQGRRIELTPEQEEMAIAWVKKLGTEYTEDPVFTKNFFHDFRLALDLKKKISPEDFDFSLVMKEVGKERAYKLSLSKEKKKRLAAERKIIREKNKEKYGYAIVDGVRVEIANYMAEPSSIFMGRGKHPLRGHWKRGPIKNDIVLNLSPDSSKPAGPWKEIAWQPNSMWIAKWID